MSVLVLCLWLSFFLCFVRSSGVVAEKKVSNDFNDEKVVYVVEYEGPYNCSKPQVGLDVIVAIGQCINGGYRKYGLSKDEKLFFECVYWNSDQCEALGPCNNDSSVQAKSFVAHETSKCVANTLASNYFQYLVGTLNDYSILNEKKVLGGNWWVICNRWIPMSGTCLQFSDDDCQEFDIENSGYYSFCPVGKCIQDVFHEQSSWVMWDTTYFPNTAYRFCDDEQTRNCQSSCAGQELYKIGCKSASSGSYGYYALDPSK